MALSDDQRAMLRLLAQREEGYQDIAALKGMSVEEVRAEVKAALAELETTPAPRPPEPEATPTPVEEKAAPQQASPPRPVGRAPSARRSVRPSVPPERRRLLAMTGGALGVVAVVLIAVAVFGGDSDSGSDGADPSLAAVEAAAAENGKLTQAVLEPADGSEASGRAIFGKVGKEEVVLQVTAENLEPTGEGESYTVWLYRTPKLTLRVGSVQVGEDGRLGAQFPIPAELLAYVASGAFDQIYVSRLDDAAYEQEVAQAKENRSLPRYSGETVMRGEITGPVARR